MSVEDNVAFGLRRDGVEKGEIKRRVGEALDLVQLGALAKRKPGQLSGGQRQRVALARSIIKRPKVLLLDEPLSALDKKLREATQFELRTIQEQVGITFVMVTHDQEEAMTMATRIAVMDHGKIVQVGKPHESLRVRPHSRFVADFIGSVNMFDGRLKEPSSDHAIVESAEAGGDLVVGPTGAQAPGAAICVAVRPEKLEAREARRGPGAAQSSRGPRARCRLSGRCLRLSRRRSRQRKARQGDGTQSRPLGRSALRPRRGR